MKLKINGSICFKEKRYSRQELNEIVKKYKRMILAEKIDGELIGVAVDRSPEMICMMFAILELGYGFVSIDMDLPKERLEYMLQNAQIQYAIADSTKATILIENGIHIIDQDQNDVYVDIPKVNIDGNKLAYVIYTSGTTGFPKGVEICHKSLENLIYAMHEAVEFERYKSIACFANTTFDMFIVEAIVSLYYGFEVFLADKEQQTNPKLMSELIEKNEIEVLQTTPSRLQLMQLIDKKFDSLKKCKLFLIGGEKFPSQLFESMHQLVDGKIYNMYGPTEATVWISSSEVTETIDLGTSFLNNEIFLCGEDNKIVSNGLGEIVLSGESLARGYRNNPNETKVHFVDIDVDGITKRCYKTGDLGEYKEERLYYVGRVDEQIKIRGYRVELGDVDCNILRNKTIKMCATCLYEHDEKQELIAFYVSEKEYTTQELQGELKEYLPAYMIPASYIQVEHLEFSRNGKLDRTSILNKWIERKSKTSKNEENDLDSKIRSIVETNLEIQIDGLDTLLESLSFSSFSYVRMLVDLEDEFDIEFDDDYLNPYFVKDFNQIKQYIEDNSDLFNN